MVESRPPSKRRGRDGEARNAWREYGAYGYVGIFWGVAVVVGVFTGRWLDARFGTEPWLTLAGALLGIAAGFKELFNVALKAMRERDESDADPDRDAHGEPGDRGDDRHGPRGGS